MPRFVSPYCSYVSRSLILPCFRSSIHLMAGSCFPPCKRWRWLSMSLLLSDPSSELLYDGQRVARYPPLYLREIEELLDVLRRLLPPRVHLLEVLLLLLGVPPRRQNLLLLAVGPGSGYIVGDGWEWEWQVGASHHTHEHNTRMHAHR